MMITSTDLTHRALLVDSETIVPQVLALALEREGFACDYASNGNQAARLVSERNYDLLVTELRIPGKNGHALACDVLKKPGRPVVMIHTSIDDPRLARDLRARGVDDILYKPTKSQLFAARARNLVEQHRASQSEGSPDPLSRSITSEELEERLQHLVSVLPMSQAALDVMDLVQEGSRGAQQIAAAAARDPSLTVQILKLANSVYYNPGGERIVELERAVVRIGMRRVGELAMATIALTALTADTLPWMDVNLAWRRSLAAGLAVDVLIDETNLQSEHEGLFLSALMHGLGRIALGTMFPREYQSLVEQCEKTNRPLLELETQLFPQSHAQVMARLLEMWNFPPEICEPLNHCLVPFARVTELADSDQPKVTLLKLAVLVGNIAVAEWEAWDVVDFPPCAPLERLGVQSVSDAIIQTTEGLVHVENFGKPTDKDSRPTAATPQRTRRMAFRSDGRRTDELLRHFASTLDCELVPESETGGERVPLLINALQQPAAEDGTPLLDFSSDQRGFDRIICLVDSNPGDVNGVTCVALPCSYTELISVFDFEPLDARESQGAELAGAKPPGDSASDSVQI